MKLWSIYWSLRNCTLLIEFMSKEVYITGKIFLPYKLDTHQTTP